MAQGSGGISRLLLVGLFAAVALGAALYRMDSSARPPGLLDRLHVRYEIIDLSSGDYRVAPALPRDPGEAETFHSMVQRLSPYAAISGTYHDQGHRPMGDLLSGGKLVYKGRQRQGIGFTKDGRIVFRERNGSSPIDWSGCVSGIACGPRLVRAGAADVDVERDGFSAAAETRRAARCAAGATSDGKLILCLVRDAITLDEMTGVMLELGAVDAINLDGGAMCAFYSDGRFRAQPVAEMSNMLAVYSR